MIDRLYPTFLLGEGYATSPDNYKLMEKINEIIDKVNEIIDKVNELDIKVHTTQLFTTQEQNDAIKKLLDLAGDEKES